MSLYRTWLADVPANPYAEQLKQGVQRLRFARPLERQYRLYQRQESYGLRRVALAFGVVVWLAFAVLDQLVIGAPERWWLLALRLGVLVLLLGYAWLLLRQPHSPWLGPFSLLCITALGVSAAAVVGIAHHRHPDFPYEGLLLICMAAYFLVGLRLSEALLSSAIMLAAYLAFDSWAGTTPARLANNLVFLLFGNLMGAVGCYLLEYRSREHFLVGNLLQLLAEQDSLTGLHNRRSFDRQLDLLWRQAQRERVQVTLLLGDVDHFKAYNDRYGHQAGDAVLRQVGQVFQQAARRPLDMAVRMGGEEFALLLYDIDAAQTQQRAEALRQAVEDLRIEHAGSTSAAVVTLSIGVVCLLPQPGQAPSSLYQQADRWLYEAKAFGRNRVMSAAQ
ncbi:diguanylate cyclase domain-containing protein [Pseudomonas sp. R-28-1W-6]|uniref:GGDEF domain-containing protein n=1 Tax=Pseudomonas sp. R-28-1W-6 TaxID=2650101 RepID=UPI003556345A